MARVKAKSDRVKVERQPIADGMIARPIGAIDLTRAPAFRVELADILSEKPARLVLDLSEVPEIDSATVATLVELLRDVYRNSGMLVLCGLQQRVRSIFEIVRLDETVFTIVETVDEAIALPNRRKFGRYRPRTLYCDHGEVMDISAGGIKLQSRRKVKGTVRLRIWNDLTDLSIEARIVRCRRLRSKQYDVGLQFVNQSTDSTKKLAGILASLRDTVTRKRNAA